MDSDRTFARVAAIGAGLIGFMVIWFIAARVTGWLAGQPGAGITALAAAIVGGVITAVVTGRRIGADTRN